MTENFRPVRKQITNSDGGAKEIVPPLFGGTLFLTNGWPLTRLRDMMGRRGHGGGREGGCPRAPEPQGNALGAPDRVLSKTEKTMRESGGGSEAFPHSPSLPNGTEWDGRQDHFGIML